MQLNIMDPARVYGKNDWILDPSKIVINPRHMALEPIPEEEEEEPIQPIIIEQKPVEKHVHFSPYVNIHVCRPLRKYNTHYPPKVLEELLSSEELLKDELLIADKRIECLENKLKTAINDAARARTMRDKMHIWVLVLILLCTFISLKSYALDL